VKRATRYLAAIFIALASLLAAGCVNVPTTGPIEEVEGQQPPCHCVNVEVKPPAQGEEAGEIVKGFLRATSNYQPNYSVARQFLTRMAAEKWSPSDSGVLIYRGSPKAVGPDKVTLQGRLVGRLEPDRSYSARDQAKWQVNFGLVRDPENGGEWRINAPPRELLVEEFWFNSFYDAYNLYFVGNNSSLVPDPIYLPALSNPANVASALMKALLKGPTAWLKPAVSSAIPPNTSLSVDSVTITDGIAEVPLSDSVLALPDPQRTLLAAQIMYALRQVGGVKGVLIKVNQQPYRVPGADPQSLVIAFDSIPPAMDPIPSVTGDQLYVVHKGGVGMVNTAADSPKIDPLNKPLSREALPVNALAVSVANTDFAVTSPDRRTIRHVPVGTGVPTTLPLSGASDLLRPQFTRYGEIWDIGRRGDRQLIWMFAPEKEHYKMVEIDSPVVRNKVAPVTAFKISPNGTRIALVRGTSTKSQVGIARIIRHDKDKVTVDGWRPLDTTSQSIGGPMISKIRDVAWLNATELLVLGAADGETAFTPFSVSQDGSQISGYGEREAWGNALELAVQPRTQSAIILGRAADGIGRTWNYDGNQWKRFVDSVSTVAYPGG
jgi:hypothetical protein